MNRLSFAIVLLTCAILSLPRMLSAADPPHQRPSPLRIGTFDPRAVALAYYRSELHQQRLAAAIAEHKQAKQAGDKQRAEQIEAERSRLQELAHRQVFGTGPYESLAQQLNDILPEVAKTQNLHLIVTQVYYAPPPTQTVDVTEEILTRLQTDQKTRKIIRDMQQKIRSGQYKPETYRGED